LSEPKQDKEASTYEDTEPEKRDCSQMFLSGEAVEWMGGETEGDTFTFTLLGVYSV
jgi:hypothetical protein